MTDDLDELLRAFGLTPSSPDNTNRAPHEHSTCGELPASIPACRSLRGRCRGLLCDSSRDVACLDARVRAEAGAVDPLPRLRPAAARGGVASRRAQSAHGDATLFGCKPHGFERAFVLYLTALLLLLIANAFPFLTLKVQGQLQSSHLISGAIDLYRQGMPEIAVAVVLFVVVFPLLKILIGLAVVGPLAFRP